jgi:hypothetical protein
MVLVRTVIEHTAGARTWRLKPEKLAKLESRESRTPGRDSLEEVGWRRPNLLNRSFGEFSHASIRAKWEWARKALASLVEIPPEAPWTLHQTASGDAMNQGCYVLGLELRHQAETHHSERGSALRDVLPIGEDEAAQADIDACLDRVWAMRWLSVVRPSS